MKFWDAMSDTPISWSNPNIGGYNIALADDFPIVAIPRDDTIEMYHVANNMLVATFTHSSEVIELALSDGGSRPMAALSNTMIAVSGMFRSTS